MPPAKRRRRRAADLLREAQKATGQVGNTMKPTRTADRATPGHTLLPGRVAGGGPQACV